MAILLLGGALAVGLVCLGAALAGAPAPTLAPSALPGSSAAPRVVNVIMRDYRFDPTPFRLYPGETIELNVFNGGMVEHELVLGDEEVQQAWAEADALATPPGPFATAPPASVGPEIGGMRVFLGSGQSMTLTYQVPTEGPLLMICNLPGHAQRGMVGEIELERR